MDKNIEIQRDDRLVNTIDALIEREKAQLLDFDSLSDSELLVRIGHFTAGVEQQASALIAEQTVRKVRESFESVHAPIHETVQEIAIPAFQDQSVSRRYKRAAGIVVSVAVLATSAWLLPLQKYAEQVSNLVSESAIAATAPDADARQAQIETNLAQAGDEWPMLSTAPTRLDDHYVEPKVERILKVTAHVANARDIPDNGGKVITRVKKGDIVSVSDEQDGWYKSRLEDGTEAWIYSSVFMPRLQVAAAIANVRAEPSNNSKIVARLQKGNWVTKLDEVQGWYLIKLDNGAEHWAYKTVF